MLVVFPSNSYLINIIVCLLFTSVWHHQLRSLVILGSALGTAHAHHAKMRVKSFKLCMYVALGWVIRRGIWWFWHDNRSKIHIRSASKFLRNSFWVSLKAKSMYLGVIFVASRECMEMEHSCFCLHVQFILRFPLFLSCHFVVEILCLKEVTVRPPEKQHFIITFCFANEYPADSKYTPSKRLGQFSI